MCTPMRPSAQTLLLTASALICFAANSILCRLALAAHEIDPAAFTAIRLISGAVVLAIIAFLRPKSPMVPFSHSLARAWISAFLLFAYAAAFSSAYLGLNAASGALILFGAVQVTMIAASILTGQRPDVAQWFGLVLAFGGLVYLVAPSLNSPPLDRALLMAIAGIAWGLYSLRAKGVADPASATANNFLRAAPLGILLALATLTNIHSNASGVIWAVMSGAITSGLGYVMWYAAVPSLGSTRAAIVQLLVPIVAAAGGVLLLGEPLNPRLAVAAALTLSGVALALRIISFKWRFPRITLIE